METSLHRALKQLYATDPVQVEARLGRYRIDVLRPTAAIEIQHGSLSAIRDKIRDLLAGHNVLLVKPLIAEKQIVTCASRGGQVVRRRRSPKQARWADLFHELIHFTTVFPHRRLTIEVLRVTVEEWRYPGHGRRRRWRRDDFQVQDQHLIEVVDRVRLATAHDLWQLLPAVPPGQFDTAELARQAEIPRFLAQRAAYCLRQTGAARTVGKRGRGWLYERASAKRRRAA